MLLHVVATPREVDRAVDRCADGPERVPLGNPQLRQLADMGQLLDLVWLKDET